MVHVNTHIHSLYSFSSFGSIDEAAQRAVEENVRVLGLSDFNTVKGFAEFESACAQRGVYPLYTIEFIALLDDDKKTGRRWNDPANPGVMYVCGKALAHPSTFGDDSRNRLRGLWKGTQDLIWRVPSRTRGESSRPDADANDNKKRKCSMADKGKLIEYAAAIRMGCARTAEGPCPPIVALDASPEAIARAGDGERMRKAAESDGLGPVCAFAADVAGEQVAKTIASGMQSGGTMPAIVAVAGTGLFGIGRTRSEATGCTTSLLEEKRGQGSGASTASASGPLRGHVVVVTGSAQGFGKGIAEELVAQGAHVVLADISDDAGQATRDAINAAYGGDRAVYVKADVTDSESLDALVFEAFKAFGGVDVFVANAGVLRAGALHEMDARIFEFVTKVNYTAFYLCAKAVAPALKLQHIYKPSYFAEIARQAGVSTATVSLVLNGKSARYRIKPETERRIRQLASTERFTANQIARGLRLRKTRTIGLIVSDITTAFFSQLSRAVEMAAQEHGYHVIIANTNDDPQMESTAVETLLARSVDGLIISSVAADPALSFPPKPVTVPVVHIDRRVEGPGVHCVTSDNRTGMYRLTSHLLGQGLTDVACIGGLPHLSTHRERLEGYAAAYREAGLSLDGRRLVDGGFTRECGYECARELLSRSSALPQGIVTVALPLFEGLLDCFRDILGDLPDSVHLATFDDHPLLDYLAMPVSSVRQDCERMGRAAFEAFASLAEGKQTAAVTTIDPVFIDRSKRRETP